MKCNCIDEVEKNTIAHLREQYPDRTFEDASGFGDLGLANVGFSLGESSGRYVYHPYKMRYTFIKKNGDISAPKSECFNITAPFCPFCGKNQSVEPLPHNHADRLYVSEEPHELEYVAEKYGIKSWQVLKIKQENNISLRKEVYQYIEHELNS